MTKDPRKIGCRAQDEPPNGNRPTKETSVPYAELVSSIREMGVKVPVFVHRRLGYCVSGQYRLWAAVDARVKQVPVVLVESEVEVGRWFDGHSSLHG